MPCWLLCLWSFPFSMCGSAMFSRSVFPALRRSWLRFCSDRSTDFWSAVSANFWLTPTTVLYLIGPGARGLVLGLVLLLFAHGTSAYITALDRKRPYALGTALILSSFAQTMLNTLANYVDSKLFGWYSPEIVFGSLAARTIVGFAQTFVFAGLAVTVLHALRNSRFIPYPAAVNR